MLISAQKSQLNSKATIYRTPTALIAVRFYSTDHVIKANKARVALAFGITISLPLQICNLPFLNSSTCIHNAVQVFHRYYSETSSRKGNYMHPGEIIQKMDLHKINSQIVDKRFEPMAHIQGDLNFEMILFRCLTLLT